MTWTVVGVGDRWRRDDGAGLEVAARLRARGTPAREAAVPLALIEILDHAPAAVVVDAVRSESSAPGTVHRLDASRTPLPSTLHGGSTHLLGLADAIELARSLGRLPPRLLVFGIEGQDFSAGTGLTPVIDRAIDQAVAAVEAEITGSR